MIDYRCGNRVGGGGRARKHQDVSFIQSTPTHGQLSGSVSDLSPEEMVRNHEGGSLDAKAAAAMAFTCAVAETWLWE